MAVLIGTRARDRCYGDREYWLVGDRFEVTIDVGKTHCNFAVMDKTLKLHPLKLNPKVLQGISIVNDPDIELMPGIDTYCITISKKERCGEIFNLIENYLLDPKNIHASELESFANYGNLNE